ncbi:MAG: hypothetical protein K8I03_03400 [Ignavibacteria bacterium]|nr:hypothetical protein [Ignavibacteria bacterium]
MKNRKVNIFIADDIHSGGINLLKKYFKLIEFKKHSTENLINSISCIQCKDKSKKDCLVLRSTRIIDEAIIKKLSEFTSIRLIVTVSAGFDNIDISECRKNGIDVMNVAGGNSISAAEFTFALILNAAKSILTANDMMKKGKFDSTQFHNFELTGKTIGIVGVGNVGSKVAKLARAFSMKVLGNDINPSLKNKYRFVKFTGLNKLLRNSDIVTVHTPLDDSTQNLINASNIRLINPNAIIINTSRGGTIDEEQLIKRLKLKKIFYAGIDVFKNEPGFNKKFTKLNNVILTPHLAGKSQQSRKRMSLMAAMCILKYYSYRRNSEKLLN